MGGVLQMPPVTRVPTCGPARAAAAVLRLDQAREGGVTLVQRGACWRAGAARPSVGAVGGVVAIRSAPRGLKLAIAQLYDVDVAIVFLKSKNTLFSIGFCRKLNGARQFVTRFLDNSSQPRWNGVNSNGNLCDELNPTW